MILYHKTAKNLENHLHHLGTCHKLRHHHQVNQKNQRLTQLATQNSRFFEENFPAACFFCTFAELNQQNSNVQDDTRTAASLHEPYW